jgi:hypothetical protein
MFFTIKILTDVSSSAFECIMRLGKPLFLNYLKL